MRKAFERGYCTCTCSSAAAVTDLQGLEAVARLRVSSGLEVDGYGGAYHRRTAADIDLPGLSSDQVQRRPALLALDVTMQGDVSTTSASMP